tara:strand:- start:4553 stop:5593 length:1041 start_codon:yes stop_codon:yes gene_type:complete
MSDDIFSQLFNLFNNDDGDVNWNLASQINNHINKESNENFLFSNSEMNYEEIFRAIQMNNQSLETPYDELEKLEILSPIEYGNWFLDSVKHFDFSNLDITSTSSFNLGSAQSSLIGMQLGNISGFLSKNTWGLSHFGIILPRSNRLAINKLNFESRISKFEIEDKESTMALMAIEFIALSFGKYNAPFLFVLEQMKKSNENLIESLGEIKTDINPTSFSNPEEIFSNIPELNNLNFDSMFDSIFAPLSFYRQVIKNTAKKFLNYLDPSVIDLVMDLGLVETNENIGEFEIKISNYDEKSQIFIDYLTDSESHFSTMDILSNIDLIPNSVEIEDPISWAARTSLPPI